jgi:MFS family permease
VEHAPVNKRGLFGSSPQVGTPIGLLMASGVMALMTVIAPGEAFLVWGWRVPFLLSFVLVIVGYLVRKHVDESPVFTELAERKQHARLPIAQLLRRHAPLLIIAALVFAGNNAVGYMTTGGFVQGYATDVEGAVRLDAGPVLAAITGSSVVWLIATFTAGALSDRIGRRTVYLIGWIVQLSGVIALFPLVNTGDVGMLFLGVSLLAVGLGLTYGPMSAFYAELFPVSVRFSGISMSYAIGAILGGAFAPTIAQAIVQATGSTSMVTVYLSGMTLIGLCATLLLRDRSGIPLGVDQAAQRDYAPAHVLAKA